MTQRDWDSAQARALTVFLNGNAISEPGPRGESIHDDSFLLMFNASPSRWSSSSPPDSARSGRPWWRPQPRRGPGRVTAPRSRPGSG